MVAVVLSLATVELVGILSNPSPSTHLMPHPPPQQEQDAESLDEPPLQTPPPQQEQDAESLFAT